MIYSKSKIVTMISKMAVHKSANYSLEADGGKGKSENSSNKGKSKSSSGEGKPNGRKSKTYKNRLVNMANLPIRNGEKRVYKFIAFGLTITGLLWLKSKNNSEDAERKGLAAEMGNIREGLDKLVSIKERELNSLHKEDAHKDEHNHKEEEHKNKEEEEHDSKEDRKSGGWASFAFSVPLC